MTGVEHPYRLEPPYEISIERHVSVFFASRVLLGAPSAVAGDATTAGEEAAGAQFGLPENTGALAPWEEATTGGVADPGTQSRGSSALSPPPGERACRAQEQPEPPASALAAEGGRMEWYIELFLGVHFAANWVPVH